MKIQPLNKTYQVTSFKECEKSNLKTASDTVSFGHSKDISLVSKQLISWAESLNKSGNDNHIILYFDNEAYATGNVQFPWAAECMVQKVKSFDELFNDNKTLQKAMLYTPVPESGLNSVSKDKAIDLILKKLKIEPKNTMVIGDGTNDIEMFDFINSRNGLAVAMGNAETNVKAHANAITKTIQDEGFFNTIEHLFD